MSEPEAIGTITERVVSRNRTRWAAKDSTEQARQRIDEIEALALPVFMALMRAEKPPYPPDAARHALDDIHARGWAADLDDAALAAAVRNRLEARWHAALDQRDQEARRKPRARDEARWPSAGAIIAVTVAVAWWLPCR